MNQEILCYNDPESAKLALACCRIFTNTDLFVKIIKFSPLKFPHYGYDKLNNIYN